jgi:hypothetical protein
LFLTSVIFETMNPSQKKSETAEFKGLKKNKRKNRIITFHGYFLTNRNN